MSLEGLNSLIQLESTRLEGAKASNSNSSQVNSSIQQQGLQAASSRQGITIQKINTEYEKDCAAATVRRLEQKLSRERASEKLSLTIACLVTVGSGLSNLWDAGKDLFAGGQKLGDIPKDLQVNPITTLPPSVSVLQVPPSGDRGVFVSGYNKDSTETVQSFSQKGSGDAYAFRSATITKEDKAIIGGAEYAALKAGNGGNDLSFAEIMQANPELGARIMAEKSHDMARGEVGAFADSIGRIKESSNNNATIPGMAGAPGTPVIAIKDTDLSSIQQGLIGAGKATEHDFKGFLPRLFDDKGNFSPNMGRGLDNVVDAGKALTSAMVNTAKDAVPYFQAYLKAKEKADKTNEELQEAVAKLNAASKKLKSIEMSIDVFAGRTA